ncbi:Leu/Phe/Val dehydrogenase [Parachitinimonas caeni]|uniref:Glu/Leu/Phe/Val dehydrogenase dimerization domain-containing protein n=1 Tax=Parachitinimonas caeni TaxID=3031301 RepID=A0ABT7DSN5_9NEIS|nr:Glu/Leu/Phe/Val dehydrogenase dimerization domain-containing protein [Parachitinimonas caeni]MDK2123077.1 Glu/Leu/Phe/Val dehydrogenase dimerization domain-containing protein [Parachitinimonas caeni]
MNVFELPDFDGHEQVVFANDPKTGLKAVIAIHNTHRGPAMGGCRMWKYVDTQAAVTDALRLSRGMTYKNAMADLPIGGGKAVIIGDARTDKTPELMLAFGEAVERVAGRYITAEDVGSSPADMALVREKTRFVAGLGGELGGRGDPSPATALGVFVGIGAAAKHRLGADSVAGMTVAVQGLGHVGYDLARQLHAAGARLIVTDIHADNCQRAAAEFGAKVVGPDEIYDVDAEVFAPCALGAIVNDKTASRFKFKIIAGAANNQLATDALGEHLKSAGILYAPDYVINAGGIIKVCAEYFKEPAEQVEGRVRKIADTLTEIFTSAASRGANPASVADEMARARFSA